MKEMRVLMIRIDRFLREARMAPTRFGRDAVGDPNFVLDLRDGRIPRSATAKRVVAFIHAHEPLSSEKLED